MQALEKVAQTQNKILHLVNHLTYYKITRNSSESCERILSWLFVYIKTKIENQ